jgi:hypothetical protein
MVRAIENWAELTGIVREVKPRPDVPQMSNVVLAVERADDVEGYPNMLADAPGRDLTVSIETEKLGGVAPGAKVRGRARRDDLEIVTVHPHGFSMG